MHTLRSLTVTLPAILCALLCGRAAQSGPPDQRAGADSANSETSWVRAIDDRAERGTLEDQVQNVRGDTGKWSETPRLQHAPPIERKPERTALDDWADQLPEDVPLTAGDDNWLLFRTDQLDDNDRVWIERIERSGNRFTVIAHLAVWQGNYRKNFTYHPLLAVNLGKLAPGEYEATWVLQRLEFNRFEDPGTPQNNWPADERPADAAPAELSVTFTVARNE